MAQEVKSNGHVGSTGKANLQTPGSLSRMDFVMNLGKIVFLP